MEEIATEVRNPDYYLCDYRRDGAIASTGSTQQQNTVQQVLSSFALLDSAGRKKVLLMEVKDFDDEVDFRFPETAPVA